jgi:hypothetical protein
MTRRHLRSGGACALLALTGCASAAPTETTFLQTTPMTTDPVVVPEHAVIEPRRRGRLAPLATTPTEPLWSAQEGERRPLVRTSDDGHVGLMRGDWDVTLAGSGGNDRDWDSGSGAVTATLGYMLTDEFEVSGRQAISMANGEGDGTRWSGATQVAIDFLVGSGPVRPFIGGSFGRVYGDEVYEAWTAAPEAGVKWFVQHDAYVMAMAEYEFAFDKASTIDDGWRDAAFVYTLGLGLRF